MSAPTIMFISGGGLASSDIGKIYIHMPHQILYSICLKQSNKNILIFEYIQKLQVNIVIADIGMVPTHSPFLCFGESDSWGRGIW